MANLQEFITNHLALVIVFVALLSYLLYTEFQNQQSNTVLSPQQVVMLMNHDNAILIDIRPREAFQSGHIINAINLSVEELEKSDKYRTEPVVLICDSGQKTSQAAVKLRKIGYQNISSLKGGMTAWKQTDLPVQA
jgi:rhodanese-related sulfurtransferase